MTIEQQVCSFDIAKQLKELGVKHESLFYWLVHISGEPGIVERSKLDSFHLSIGEIPISAFTVAELGEMLKPYQFLEVGTMSGPQIWVLFCNFRECVYRFGDHVRSQIVGDTEADARAKMLIYLLRKKLITL